MLVHILPITPLTRTTHRGRGSGRVYTNDTQRPRSQAPSMYDQYLPCCPCCPPEVTGLRSTSTRSYPAAMSLHVRSLRLVAVRRIRIRIFRHALVYRKHPSVYRYTSDHSSTRTTHRGNGSNQHQQLAISNSNQQSAISNQQSAISNQQSAISNQQSEHVTTKHT